MGEAVACRGPDVGIGREVCDGTGTCRGRQCEGNVNHGYPGTFEIGTYLPLPALLRDEGLLYGGRRSTC